MMDDFKELDIQFETREIEAKTRKLKASWSLDAMQDIQALHGSISDEMRSISDEMQKKIDQEKFDKELSYKLDALGFGDEEDEL